MNAEPVPSESVDVGLAYQLIVPVANTVSVVEPLEHWLKLEGMVMLVGVSPGVQVMLVIPFTLPADGMAKTTVVMEAFEQ